MFFLFYSFFIFTTVEASDWTDHALRLTGESKRVRAQAKVGLRRIPHLNDKLELGLQGKNKFLALDVIAAMSLHSFLPELFKLSETDPNGAVYLAINSLIRKENQAEIAKLYRERLLGNSKVSVSHPSQVVILDTLGRMRVPLPQKTVESLLESDSYDVRMAAVYYTRHFLLKNQKKNYLSILASALKMKPYQLRLQTLFIILELPKAYKKTFAPHLAQCEKDKHEEVKRLCTDLKKEIL